MTEHIKKQPFELADKPWQKDACSLVEEFRQKRRSPLEELELSIKAIESSNLNSVSFVDFENAISLAKHADISKPFGGVPWLIKELDPVKGWPQTDASLLFQDRIASYSSHAVVKLQNIGGAIPVGLSTASEFGGLNVSISKLNGITHNPWKHGYSAGGSSGGAAASVAGGLVSLATGGDGGGSIRIPAGYCGLLGMKGTFGRVTRAPHAYQRPNTVVAGILARSVRDAARYYDVCAGLDPWDPSTIESHGNWENNLGTFDLRGKKVAVLPDLGGFKLEPGIFEMISHHADMLISELKLNRVELSLKFPNIAPYWMMENLVTLIGELGKKWPSRWQDMTDEVATGLFLAQSFYNLKTAALTEMRRIEANEVMAKAFEQVDFIICATNPGPAFEAEKTKSNKERDLIDIFKESKYIKRAAPIVLSVLKVISSTYQDLPIKLMDAVAQKFPDMMEMGALTMISNIYGNPAVSIPIGFQDELPIGMQVLGRRFEDELLFDIAYRVEQERPWPTSIFEC